MRRELTWRSSLIGLTVAVLVLLALPAWAAIVLIPGLHNGAPFNGNCNPDSVDACNVETTLSGESSLSWNGVSATFATDPATTSYEVVESVGVIANENNFVETGWSYPSSGLGSCCAHYGFISTFYQGVYQYQYVSGVLSGSLGWGIKWVPNDYGPGFGAWDMGSRQVGFEYYIDPGNFQSGVPITNAERHDSDDEFNAYPFFHGLQFYSANWYAWPGPLKFAAGTTDPDWACRKAQDIAQNEHYVVNGLHGIGNCD